MVIERLSREVRHEYVAGEIFAVAGGSVEHEALASALNGLLFGHLRGGPCRPYGSDLGLSIRRAEVATCADLVVVCDPVECDPESPHHVTNPKVAFEVLSPTTERYDREQKRLYYQQLDSLREYVLISQDRRQVEVWSLGGREMWVRSVAGPGERIELPSIDWGLAVDELYDVTGVKGGATSAPR